jgi:arylsulfatase
MLHHLQRLWLIEAAKYNVLPLDDRMLERANPDIAGRPELIRGQRQVVFGGAGRLSEHSALNLKNKTHAVTAEIEVPGNGAQGVIVAQGGITGGWSLYMHEGTLRYCYNFVGLSHYIIAGEGTVPSGTHQVRMEFAYDGGGLAKGGAASLFLDGDQVGKGRVERTEPFIFSADETLDTGSDGASSVSPDYTPETSVFTGAVNWVELAIDAAAEDADHQLSEQERFRVAMAIQ